MKFLPSFLRNIISVFIIITTSFCFTFAQIDFEILPGTIEIDEGISDIVSKDLFVFMCTDMGVYPVDLTEQSNPVVGQAIEGIKGYHMHIVGDKLYSLHEQKLYITDISDPSNPIKITEWQAESWDPEIAVKDNLIFLVYPNVGSIISVMDFTNPNSPTKIGEIDLEIDEKPRELVISEDGNTLYFGTQFLKGMGGWLKSIDVSTPSNPQVISEIELRRKPMNMIVDDDVIFMASNGATTVLFAIDVSDSENMEILGEAEDSRWVWDVHKIGDYVAMSGRNGLAIFEFNRAAGKINSDLQDNSTLTLKDNIQDFEYSCEYDVVQREDEYEVVTTTDEIVDMNYKSTYGIAKRGKIPKMEIIPGLILNSTSKSTYGCLDEIENMEEKKLIIMNGTLQASDADDWVIYQVLFDINPEADDDIKTAHIYFGNEWASEAEIDKSEKLTFNIEENGSIKKGETIAFKVEVELRERFSYRCAGDKDEGIIDISISTNVGNIEAEPVLYKNKYSKTPEGVDFNSGDNIYFCIENETQDKYYTYIEPALEEAMENDVLVFCSGSYEGEKIEISTAGLTMKSRGDDNARLSSLEDKFHPLVIKADKVNLINLTIFYKLILNGVKECNIYKNTFLGEMPMVQSRLTMENTHSCWIKDNTFMDDKMGIKMINDVDSEIEDNYFKNLSYGMEIESCNYSKIIGNNFDGNAGGIEILNSRSILVYKNIARQKSTPYRDGLKIEGGTKNIIKNNVFQGSYHGGALLRTHGNLIKNNTFEFSLYGIHLRHTFDNKIYNNIIRNNTECGVYVKNIGRDDFKGNFFMGNGIIGLPDIGFKNESLLNEELHAGILIDDSNPILIDNHFEKDSANAILSMNNSNPKIENNNFIDVDGYAINNLDEATTLNAMNNYWGDASGPSGEGSGSGTKVSSGVDYGDWLEDKVALVGMAIQDTVYAFKGDTIEISFGFQNWEIFDDEITITLTDDEGWLLPMEKTVFTMEDSLGTSVSATITIPDDLSGETGNTIVCNAVSNNNAEWTSTVQSVIGGYSEKVEKLNIIPEAILLAKGESIQLSAVKSDQYFNDISSATVTWEVEGGEIDSNSVYTAGEEPGIYTLTASDVNSDLTTTATVEILDSVFTNIDSKIINPKGSKFLLISPNPFSENTKLQFFVDNIMPVSIKIYDITGRYIETVIDDIMNIGSYEFNWQSNGLPSGIYIYRLSHGQNNEMGYILISR